jgi:hypothetical protein
MPSQNNPGAQFDKRHAVTVEAQAALVTARFIGYDGLYATSAGGVKDAQGVSENNADALQAVSVITGYSALVEASAPIAFGAYVRPADDGTGRAVTGLITNHCGRALGAATAAGQMVEVEIKPHVHP